MKEKKSKTSTYKKIDEIIQPKDITYPIAIQKDMPKFEKLITIRFIK